MPLSMVYRTHRVRQPSGTDKSIGEEWTHAVNRPCAVLSSSTDSKTSKVLLEGPLDESEGNGAAIVSVDRRRKGS